MSDTYSIGKASWSREELFNSLEEFAQLYEKRPIKDNEGGMKAAQMFYAWFVAKELQPTTIIESGVWYGQSTWMFEQVAPNATLHCIDPAKYYNKGYRSDKATYHKKDFTTLDWSGIDAKTTFCFFDDHQNALHRILHCAELGIEHLMFEDNYPPGIGDCYSLKKAFHSTETREILPGLPISTYLHNIIETYQEFPPIFSAEKNRWGDDWNHYDTDSPLLEKSEQAFHEIYLEEATNYTWVNYVRLAQKKERSLVLDLTKTKRIIDWSAML